jgi:cellulose synthase/poly-beta-1,6-N-acetylglucosamine synthase-like glycosyltransferase
MPQPLAILQFTILVALIVGQAVLVLGMIRSLRAAPPTLLASADCPRAAVILCLRGADPFLPQCLDAILGQDYPDYQVWIVVDHETDPSLDMVRARLPKAGGDRVQLRFLRGASECCSLKCASLVQAISELPDEFQIVALVDADVVAHSTWLRELATALRPEDVGAATGNRWYQPDRPTLGALVRYGWNAAAIVQMFWYGIPWGGTLALKMSAIRDAALLQKWGTAFCEDTLLYSALRLQGRRVAFVPSLMMVNRESCGIPGFYEWVRRQLFVARLYHPTWWLVVAHGLGTALALLATILALIAAVRDEQSASAACWLAAGLAIYFAGLLAMLVGLETAVRRIVAARRQRTRWITPLTLLKIPGSVLVTQAVYPAALVAAMLLRRVSWRGVDYQVDSRWKIRLLQYAPYQSPKSSPEPDHSL